MPQERHRRSIRLRGYDYSQSGAYFITICTVGRDCLLGEVQHEEVTPTPVGQVVRETWGELSARFPGAMTDAFVVMPNHVHGIIFLGTSEDAAPPRGRAEGRASAAPTSATLSAVVQAFKSLSTLQVNRLLVRAGPLWQRNYYERIIRTEDELERVRRYIAENPMKWAEDEENPERVKPGSGR